MKNSDLRGIDQDYNRQLNYNKSHGGVSDELKKTMKRPESTSHAAWATKSMLYTDQDKYAEGWERAFGKKKNI